MSGEAESPCVEFRVLGPFDVLRNGGTIALGAHRQRALLLLLFLHSDELVSRDRLIDELWGERAPGSAPNMVQVYVSRLRKVLGPGLLVTQPPGYVLRVGEAQVDATKFEELVGQARDSLADDAAGAARDLLDEAIATWRGPPLADFAYESFAQGDIARLQELRLEAIELRIDADLTLGRQVALVGELEQLIGLHPFRERLRGQLMVALYRSGRQAEALDAYRAARSALVEDLGLGPSPALRRLEQAILDQDPSLDATEKSAAAGQLQRAGPAGNLPPELTSLLGRELELEQVGELVERHRVVTIVGPGGVGKTRVALRVASAAANRFPDGVWFVDLAPVGSSDDVAEAVSSALGMADRPGSSTLDTLTIELRERRLLLLLDNCEHVLASAAEVTARLLGQCPDVTILATSREPLAIAGESVERLAPLATTAIGADPPAAVRLFLERAETQGASWEEPELVLETIRELCVRLDGIPLAIELAAARTRAISPADLLAKLDDRLRLLVSPHHRSAPSRQQTLEATIAWSYELLDADEQATLRRLAVFQGSFSLAAAAAVCADMGSELDALERVTALVDRSVLSVQRRADTNRYRLLESIAVFAGQHLSELGEADQACDRHSRFFQLLARVASGPEYDSEQADWAARLDLEQDNLTAALAWCFDGQGDPAIGAELAANLGLHLIFRGRSHAAQRWLGRSLEFAQRIPASTLVAVNLAYAHLAYSTTDIDTSVARAIDAVATARETGNQELLAEALAQLALADQASGASAAASTVAAELRSIQSRLSNPRAQVMALLGTAQVALATGHPEQAKADASGARQIARRVGDHLRAASSGYWFAYALALKSEIQSARDAIGEATNDAKRSGYQLVVVDTLIAATTLALVDGDLETAGRLLPTIVTMLREQQRWEDLGACLRLAAAVELKHGSPERSAVLLAASLRWTDHLDFQDELLLPELAELGELLNARLGEGTFAAQSERGAEMSLEGVASFIAS
jgi:predicted ATPase/DNA-binding SARP family transcriptional activator